MRSVSSRPAPLRYAPPSRGPYLSQAGYGRNSKVVSKSNARTLFLLLLVVVLATSCAYFSDRSGSGTQSSTAFAGTSLDGLKLDACEGE